MKCFIFQFVLLVLTVLAAPLTVGAMGDLFVTQSQVYVNALLVTLALAAGKVSMRLISRCLCSLSVYSYRM